MILVRIMMLMLALMRMLTLTVIRNIQVMRTVTLVLILMLTPTLISMPVLSWDRVARALTISAYDSSFWRMQQAEQRCYPYGPAQRRNQRMARKLKSVANRGMANLRCERHDV